MNDERPRNNQGEAEGGTSGDQVPSGSDMPNCCGPDMAQMMEACPCGSFLKKHWLGAGVIFLVMFLMFLISQVGGILGIIAFFRTL